MSERTATTTCTKFERMKIRWTTHAINAVTMSNSYLSCLIAQCLPVQHRSHLRPAGIGLQLSHQGELAPLEVGRRSYPGL